MSSTSSSRHNTEQQQEHESPPQQQDTELNMHSMNENQTIQDSHAMMPPTHLITTKGNNGEMKSHHHQELDPLYEKSNNMNALSSSSSNVDASDVVLALDGSSTPLPNCNRIEIPSEEERMNEEEHANDPGRDLAKLSTSYMEQPKDWEAHGTISQNQHHATTIPNMNTCVAINNNYSTSNHINTTSTSSTTSTSPNSTSTNNHILNHHHHRDTDDEKAPSTTHVVLESSDSTKTTNTFEKHITLNHHSSNLINHTTCTNNKDTEPSSQSTHVHEEASMISSTCNSFRGPPDQPFHLSKHNNDAPSSPHMMMMTNKLSDGDLEQQNSTPFEPNLASNPIQTNYLNDENNSNKETPISVPIRPIATNTNPVPQPMDAVYSTVWSSPSSKTFSSTSPVGVPTITSTIANTTTTSATTTFSSVAATSATQGSTALMDATSSSPYPLPPPMMPIHHHPHASPSSSTNLTQPSPPHPSMHSNYSSRPPPPLQHPHHAYPHAYPSHAPSRYQQPPPYGGYSHSFPPPPSPTYHATSQTHSYHFYNQSTYNHLPHSTSSGHSYMHPPSSSHYPYTPTLPPSSSYPSEYTYSPPQTYHVPSGSPPSSSSHVQQPPSMYDMSKNFVPSQSNNFTHSSTSSVMEYNTNATSTPTSITSSTTDRSATANRPVPVAAVARKTTQNSKNTKSTPSKNKTAGATVTSMSTSVAQTKLLQTPPTESSSSSNTRFPSVFASFSSENRAIANSSSRPRNGITKTFQLPKIDGDDITLLFSFYIEPPHDIRMKKACLEVEVNQNSSNQKEITRYYWRVKSLEIYEKTCFFRYKKTQSGESDQNWQLDNENYDINGFSITKTYDDMNDGQKVYFSLESYGKRVQKSKHCEKAVTCPFKVTLSLTDGKDEVRTITKCICIHMDIKKVDKKTVITKATFHDHVFETDDMERFFAKYNARQQQWKCETRAQKRKSPPSSSNEQLDDSIGQSDESSASSSQLSEMKKKTDSTTKRKKTFSYRHSTSLLLTHGSSSFDNLNEIVIHPENLSVHEFSSLLEDWSISQRVADVIVNCKVINVTIDQSAIRIYFIIPRVMLPTFDHSIETKTSIEIRFKGEELPSPLCYTFNSKP
ncbi:hypothetical protein C9374_014127 [Naegleria lovaniensis]|uniref:Uncharacterized protein n=1 Tax=Naegleria lovaniensis TaxID=51637 RepID=A0AA88GYR8_NAELO|nr:uncharacterized protein C9374_014127 [Naegleria lovaniensis]KAG2389567.1 hypothetical protein C9374_014127 [Naegleria lovaniensis]